MFIAIIATFVVIATVVLFWVWRAPSAGAERPLADDSESSSGGGGSKARRSAAIMADMKAAHSGGNAKERQMKEEWKASHPDGFTKQ